MTYLYKCNSCFKEIKIVKSMAESSKVEFCEICNVELERVYSVGIKTGDGVK